MDDGEIGSEILQNKFVVMFQVCVKKIKKRVDL
jgi:hypothetical protein